MSQKLAGSVVVITGASAGIGRASALALAAEGASLVLTARREHRLDELVQAVQAQGGRAVAVVGDARLEETAQRAIAAAKAKFGTVNILINNVGIGNYKPLIETSAVDYDEMMDSNVRSTFLFTRQALPLMMEQKSGTILMISSMAGFMASQARPSTALPSLRRLALLRRSTKNCARMALRSASSAPEASKRSLPSARVALSRASQVQAGSTPKTSPRPSCWPARSQPVRASLRFKCAP